VIWTYGEYGDLAQLALSASRLPAKNGGPSTPFVASGWSTSRRPRRMRVDPY
jgi:hypothetical protein